jgi:hypothetical protein
VSAAFELSPSPDQIDLRRERRIGRNEADPEALLNDVERDLP